MNKSAFKLKIRLICLVVFTAFFFITSCSKIGESVQEENTPYYLAAYIWPSCHHDERFGDMLWPEGNGEWEVIKKGDQRFDGHYQPKQPLWGYELDNDPKVMEKWIDTATNFGINVFIFDWYWYDSGPFLESSLNDGFLKAKNNEKMQFYIMWANHDVRKNYWNVHKYENDTSLLWKGAVDFPDFKVMVERIIRQYFHKPNYFKIDGEPIFHIFSPDDMVKGFGDLEKTKYALNYFREETKKAGFPGLHIQVRVKDSMEPKLLSPKYDEGKGINEIIDYLGINSTTKYGWGRQEDYLKLGVSALEKRETLDSVLNVPYFPNVSIGWDATPRFPEHGKEDITHINVTPESFGAFLYKAKEYCANHPDETNLITIFSWNEWVEGSYLLPDMKYGFSYLEQVKKIMEKED